MNWRSIGTGALGWRVVGAALALVVCSRAEGVPGPGVVMRDITSKVAMLELPSGMRIVVEEDHSQPIVAVVAVVDVGSAQDPVGKEGLAHLIEHLTFRARPDGKVQRSNQLEIAGASSWNAFTSHDLTTYVTVGPKESLTSLLAIEGSRLLKPLAGLDPRAFEVERDVVKNELSRRDEQGEVSAVDARLYAALYPVNHPYHRPIGGTEATVGGLTLADAEAFANENYLPRNVTLYIAGDVDIGSIKQVFNASLPAEFLDPPPAGATVALNRLPAAIPTVPPVPAAGPLQTVRAPAETPMLYIAWSMPRGFGGDGYLQRFTRAAFSAASVWAGASGSSDIAGIATQLDRGKNGTTLICAVQLKEGRNPEKSLERVLDQIIRIWEPGRAVGGDRSFLGLQSTTLVGLALQTESVSSRAVDKAILFHFTGDLGAWGKDISAIGTLTSSKMQNFAFEWLTRARARAVFVEPSSGGTRSVDASGRALVFAPADGVRVRLDPAALKTYVHAPGGEFRTLTLKNGLKVALVRRTSVPTVTVTLGVRGGEATGEPLGAVELADTLANPTQTRNGPASKYGARVTSWSTADASYYEGRATSGNLENVLAILSDTVQSLHVDDTYKMVWDQVMNGLRRREVGATAKGERTFRSAVFPGSPYGRTAEAATFDRLTIGDAQGWINRSFRPRNAALAVVGDIDFAATEKLIHDWFDGWSGDVDRTAEASLGALGERTGPVQVVKVDRPGAKQTEIRFGCSALARTPADMIALRLLGSRLRGRVGSLARGSLGGSYGFQGGAYLHRQAGYLDIDGTVDDRALTRVLALTRKELDELGTVKPSDDELNLLKWSQGIAANVRFATNADLAKALVWIQLADVPLDYVKKYPELLDAVTADDVARMGAACRKTAVLLLTGDPGVVANALKATAR